MIKKVIKRFFIFAGLLFGLLIVLFLFLNNKEVVLDNKEVNVLDNKEVDINTFNYLEQFYKPTDFVINDNGKLRKRIVEDYLFLEGAINSETYDNIVKLLQKNPNVKSIVFTNVPGSLDDEINLKLARYIYDNNYTTIIPKKGLIASGGVDLYLSGRTRLLQDGATVGVHSWAILNKSTEEIVAGNTFPRDSEVHKPYLEYYNYVQIPEEFYWFTLNTSAKKIYKMTNEELKKYKIYTKFFSLEKKEKTSKVKLQIISNPNYEKYVDESNIKRDLSNYLDYKAKGFVKFMEYKTAEGPILIFAQNKITDEQILRAYNILDFYLTDFNNTDKSKKLVAESMAKNKAILIVPNKKDGENNVEIGGQPLYELEFPVEGDKNYITNNYEFRDAGFEEILHLVHDYGIGTTQIPRALPRLSQKIKSATFNALPADRKDWGKSGIWGLGSKDWLYELDQKGIEASLEQEYLAAVIDSYYGLWEAYEGDKGMWGIYTPKTRGEIKIEDPIGYKLVSENFFNTHLTYMARIDKNFEGTFKIKLDENEKYTYKSQYLVNVRLLGNKNTNILGNKQDNIFIGNSGDNVIDGGNGYDVVQFPKKSTEYQIIKSGKSIIVIGEGKDILKNIKILRFEDKDIDVSSII